MLTMPVNTVVDSHIEADKNDAARAELHCQIDRLKSAIAAGTDKARACNDAIASLVSVAGIHAFNELQRWISFTNLPETSKFSSLKFRQASIQKPPLAITGIKHVRPWREPPTFVDYKKLRPAAGLREVFACCTWAGGDDDGCMTPP